MRANVFDGLTRHLATALTRRQGLTGLAAAVGALVVRSTSGEAAPVNGELCIRVGKRCSKRSYRCCGKAVCKKSRCQCRKHFKRCKGTCIARNRCCGGCKGNRVCQNGRCLPPAGCGAGGPCTVFTTSTLHTGDLGGLTGADQICQQRADAANLPGTYLAWLADDTTAPADRFYQSPAPYLRTDGLPVAADWSELTSGLINISMDRTETGAVVLDDREAWTNVAADGSAALTDPALICANWTSDTGAVGGLQLAGRVGETDQTDADWTSSHDDSCDNTWRLYCVQQP